MPQDEGDTARRIPKCVQTFALVKFRLENGVCLQLDALIEAFGTTKQKRALSSRRMNEVGNDTLQKAVARAASNVIDQKGLEGKKRARCNSIVDSLDLKTDLCVLPGARFLSFALSLTTGRGGFPGPDRIHSVSTAL